MRGTFKGLVAAAAVLAATAALSRPFFDPRAEKRDTIDADPAFSALARDPACHMRLYNPEVYMPAHHDAPLSGRRSLWRATEPLFQALKVDNPNLVTVSRGYFEPVWFNTDANVEHDRR